MPKGKGRVGLPPGLYKFIPSPFGEFYPERSRTDSEAGLPALTGVNSVEGGCHRTDDLGPAVCARTLADLSQSSSKTPISESTSFANGRSL